MRNNTATQRIATLLCLFIFALITQGCATKQMGGYAKDKKRSVYYFVGDSSCQINMIINEDKISCYDTNGDFTETRSSISSYEYQKIVRKHQQRQSNSPGALEAIVGALQALDSGMNKNRSSSSGYNSYTPSKPYNFTFGQSRSYGSGYQSNDAFGNYANSNSSYTTKGAFGNYQNSNSSYTTKDAFGNYQNSRDCYTATDAFGNYQNSSGCR